MNIEDIREKLAEKINSDSEWGDKLNDTQPGHYGVGHWEVETSKDNVWVDIPTKTFTFKDVPFSFEVRLHSSREEDGTDMSFSKIAKGEGHFEFTSDSKNITIKDMEIEVDLDLFGED